MLNENRKTDLIKLCQKLIQQKSYSGEENLVANVIDSYGKEKKFDEIITDKYGNLILSIEGDKPGPKVLLDGHMDTVPVTEKNWELDPFSGKIQDGKIYGRGSSDMKGALSAMLCAVTNYAIDRNFQFPGTIYISCSVHEESFEGIATREISKRIDPDYVVIGEPSNLKLCIGQKGRAEIALETFGEPAHSSSPEKGVNAVYSMIEVVNEIRKLPINTHDALGEGLYELTDIKSTPYPGLSVVPSYCRATIDRRLLIYETKDSVLKALSESIDKLKKINSNLKANVSFVYGEDTCYTGKKISAERFFPAWLFDETDKFVQNAICSLEKYGLKPQVSHYSFCTNGSHYAGEKGIPTVGFGPSQESLAHVDNEYIEISQLEKACSGYYALLEGFTHMDV